MNLEQVRDFCKVLSDDSNEHIVLVKGEESMVCSVSANEKTLKLLIANWVSEDIELAAIVISGVFAAIIDELTKNGYSEEEANELIKKQFKEW